MTTHLVKSNRLAFLLLLAAAVSFGNPLLAASLTVAPSAISNTYEGMVTLEIGGLTNGETVVVGKFADLNGNGIWDANDWLMRGFRVTDGKVKTIGGATNYNVPCDLTGTNGAITTLLNYTASDEPDHVVGNYFFAVSSASGFATNLLAVTNWPYSQTITGTVLSSGTNVPNAIVVLLVPLPGGDMEFSSGTMADGSGNYSIHMPPGVYVPLPFRRGFVADMASPVVVSLATNATVTTNLNLLPATHTLAGRVVAAGDTNAGLGGVFLFLQSEDGRVAISSTDSNGFFNVPVTAGLWQIEPDGFALATLGFVGLDESPGFDVTAGNVTNALIAVPWGEAMFYGTIQTDSNAPLPGIRFWGNDGNLYEADGLSDANGNYSLAVLPGMWSVGVNSDDPALAGYVVAGSTNTVIASGQAIRVDYTATRATGKISGWVKDTTNDPVVGLNVYAHADIGGKHYNQDAHTDMNGDYSLDVINGTWYVGLSCEGESGLAERGYECVDEQAVSVPPTNAVVNFTVHPPGPLEITTAALPDGQAGTYYSTQVYASGGRQPYSWSLAPGSDPLPPGLSLWSYGGIDGTPTTNGTFNFTVRVTDSSPTNVQKALSITVNSAPSQEPVIEEPQRTVDGQFQFSFNTFAGTNYTLLYSTTLTNWLPILTFRGPGGVMTIIDPNTTDPVRFYRIRVGP